MEVDLYLNMFLIKYIYILYPPFFWFLPGMDALIAQLRDGSVTLRRNQRRKTHTNAALQEMFAVLEQSRTQNRSSKQLVDSDFRLSGSISRNVANSKTSAPPPPPSLTIITKQPTADSSDQDETIFV